MRDGAEHDVRRMLGLAVQILEDMPEWLQPSSNMDNMRAILAGEETGRDGVAITEAVATALVYRTQQATAQALDLQELRALFSLSRRCDARLFAAKYFEACDRLARADHRRL